MEKDRRVELLSPAGNEEGFYGAVHAGADAVYLAGGRFGARAYADNFTSETLVACIRYAHLLGRKIYLTVNTLLKEDELTELYDYLLPFYEAGLDAVIVQDLGVLRFIRMHFPNLKLHVSTQMTLCGSYGASLLKRMGASRVVPARELGLQELAAMKREACVEIEAFIHGAMCYCYSGQCLFSSILGGRSGNRGRCAQPCRLPYSVNVGDWTENECYPISLKDMCTIEHIPALIEAGIDSFKIEGRMKKPEYTAGVTEVYRRYIDSYYKLRKDRGTEAAAAAYHVDKADMELLQSLYIRSGIQDGYCFRRSGREMITLESPAYSGSNEKTLAKIREEHISTREKLPVSVKAVFQVGQPAEATYTWKDRSCHIKGGIVERAGKQPITSENIRKQLGKLGESSFQIADMQIIADKDGFYPLKQINDMRRAALAGLEGQILSYRGYPSGKNPAAEEAETNLSNPAVKKPDTDMPNPAAEKPDTDMPNMAVERYCTNMPNPEVSAPSAQKSYVISVCTLPQLSAAAKWFSCEKTGRPLRFYIEGDLFLSEQEAVLEICSHMPPESRFYLALPYILRKSDRHYMERLFAAFQESRVFRGFLARSMDGLGFIREFVEKDHSPLCRTDAGVYVWNQWAARELSSYAEGFCLPYELKGGEQRGLADTFSCEKIVYGRIPMMLTANCLFKTFLRCRQTDHAESEAGLRKNGKAGRRYVRNGESFETISCSDRHHTIPKEQNHAIPKDRYHAILKDRYHAILKDRYRRDFPVVANCLHCMNIIYNTVPLSLHQSVSKWQGRADLRMDFTLESPDEVTALLDSFLKGAPLPLKEYTTGHEKRGVE